jgi:hypothetical protein
MTDDGRLLALGLGLVGLGAAAARRGSRVRTIRPWRPLVFLSDVGGYEGQNRTARFAVVVVDARALSVLRKSRDAFFRLRNELKGELYDLRLGWPEVIWFARVPTELAPGMTEREGRELEDALCGGEPVDFGQIDLGLLRSTDIHVRTEVGRAVIGDRGPVFTAVEKYSDASVETSEIPWDSIFPSDKLES